MAVRLYLYMDLNLPLKILLLQQYIPLEEELCSEDANENTPKCRGVDLFRMLICFVGVNV